jgi:ABC-type transport system substrate-binding protein
VSFEANKDWHRGAPLSNRVIIRHIVEPQAQQLGVEKGDLDIVRSLGKDQLAVVRTKPGIKVVQGDRGLHQMMMMIPLTCEPQFEAWCRNKLVCPTPILWAM